GRGWHGPGGPVDRPQACPERAGERHSSRSAQALARVAHDNPLPSPDESDGAEMPDDNCSRWLHDQSPADGASLPRSAELGKNIKQLDDWVNRIRSRREGKKSA